MIGLRFYPDSVRVDPNQGEPIIVHRSIESGRSDFDYIFAAVYAKFESSLYAEDCCETSLQSAL